MASIFQLINSDLDEVIVPNLQLATTFWQRFRGLQLRRRLAADEGLLLTPCRSIHTHWMKFAIDVACLNSEGVVVQITRGVKPWHAVIGPPMTHAMLEATEGVLAQLTAGTTLHVASIDPSCPAPDLFSQV